MLSPFYFVACSVPPLIQYSTETPPLILAPSSTAGITDQRGRFREIFCAITDAHGAQFQDHRPCDEALVRLADEPPPTGHPVHLERAGSNLRFAIVPGLGWACFRKSTLPPERTPIRHVQSLGYELTEISVDALSSSARNANQIRDFTLGNTDLQDYKRLVLIGYSKGTPDILEALVLYPEIHDRVAAVVNIAGAVGGSPLADVAPDFMLRMIDDLPGADCEEGDGGGVESLKTSTRKTWLAKHPLPDAIQYYSIVNTCARHRCSPLRAATTVDSQSAALGHDRAPRIFWGSHMSQGPGDFSRWEQPQCLDPEG